MLSNCLHDLSPSLSFSLSPSFPPSLCLFSLLPSLFFPSFPLSFPLLPSLFSPPSLSLFPLLPSLFSPSFPLSFPPPSLSIYRSTTKVFKVPVWGMISRRVTFGRLISSHVTFQQMSCDYHVIVSQFSRSLGKDELTGVKESVSSWTAGDKVEAGGAEGGASQIGPRLPAVPSTSGAMKGPMIGPIIGPSLPVSPVSKPAQPVCYIGQCLRSLGTRLMFAYPGSRCCHGEEL